MMQLNHLKLGAPKNLGRTSRTNFHLQPDPAA